jgi:hypothetical protein
MVNQTPIQWFCKKKNVVETATYGSEFMVARQATEQIMDLRYTLRMMGIPIDGPAWLFGDNQSVIISSNIPHSNLHKRHNALSYHRVREAIAAEIMYFLHMDGKYNPSDILTKFLNWAKFWPLVQPLLFWKGETAKDPQTTIPLTQMIKAIKTAALPSGSRGVTSGNNDVPIQEYTLVNPSGNTPIVSYTQSVSPHPNISSIGQELSSGELQQYIEPGKTILVSTVRPSGHPGDMLPPGTSMRPGRYSKKSTTGTISTTATADVHSNRVEGHALARAQHTPNLKVHPGTGNEVGSHRILEPVQFSTDVELGSTWILVQPRKSKI